MEYLPYLYHILLLILSLMHRVHGAAVPGPQTGLDITDLDGAVQGYCKLGIAPSTRKTYESAVRQFGSFYSKYSITNPFPVDEAILCYFVGFLAKDVLVTQSIKSYLAAIRHTQIEAGLLEPKSLSSHL